MNWIIENLEKVSKNQYLIFDEIKYSYLQLKEEISKCFDKISSKIERGKTVAILSDYCFESVSLFFALLENDNIIVPITSKIQTDIDEKIKTSLSHFYIEIKRNELIITSTEFSEISYPLVEVLVNSGKAGLILFSSGSTGKPKAMIHDLDNLVDSFKNKKGKSLSFLVFLMFDHIGGVNTLLNCISMGATIVLPSNRDPIEVCRILCKYDINILPASPTFLNLILLSGAHLQFDLSSLRLITYGTEPMPSSLLNRLKEAFPKVKFLQTFGTSETGISQMSSKSSTSTLMRFEDGNTETKVIDGELFIRSKTQILGYLNSSMDRFTEDGWFRTGDLVEESDDGFFKIVGRNSEIINVGGEKVLPSEVESVLFQFEKIQDCIVFGEFSPITGQIVVAKVLYAEDIPSNIMKKEIQNFCKNKIEGYKIPVKIIQMQNAEFSERFKKRRV